MCDIIARAQKQHSRQRYKHVVYVQMVQTMSVRDSNTQTDTNTSREHFQFALNF